MNFRLSENSLFAILMRSPWWISFAISVAVFGLARLFVPTVYALIVPLPFVVIGAMAAWRQLRAPSAARIAATLDAIRAMSWEEFSAALEDAYRREGYAVTRVAGAAADFELAKSWQVTLVACKRWKATRTGVEPLRELEAAARAREAHERVYVAAGEITDTARAFAAEKKIRLLHDAELAQLLLRAGHGKK
jgi:restriction system protein